MNPFKPLQSHRQRRTIMLNLNTVCHILKYLSLTPIEFKEEEEKKLTALQTVHTSQYVLN